MNEYSFETVIDVLAREIDMLRYRANTAEDENIKLRQQVENYKEENANLRAMIEERDEKHE